MTTRSPAHNSPDPNSPDHRAPTDRVSGSDKAAPSIVTVPRTYYIAWALGITVLGVGLGFVAPHLLGWIVELLERTPFGAPTPMIFVSELSAGWSVATFSVLGAVGGVIIALALVEESLRVEITDDHVLLDGPSQATQLQRRQVGSVHLVSDHLVALGTDGRQLARRKADGLPQRRLRAAFETRQIPFATSDPHHHRYQRWVDRRPDLDDATHNLLRRRAEAVEDKKPTRAANLHEQLQDRGIVVRDKDGQQQYRGLVAPVTSEPEPQNRPQHEPDSTPQNPEPR